MARCCRDIALAQSIARTLLHDDPVALQLLDTHAPTPVSVQQHSVESGAPCAPALSLPVGVQAHYVKALLDWAVSQLVRQQPQQQKQKKAKDGALPAPESEQQQAQQQNGHPRERPAAWDLLAALLACKWSGLASSSAVPPSILASVGAACQHAAGGHSALRGMQVTSRHGSHMVAVCAVSQPGGQAGTQTCLNHCCNGQTLQG